MNQNIVNRLQYGSLPSSTLDKVIIDTDCGVDDTFCLANFLAYHRAGRCRLLGITTVCGNIPTDTAFQSTSVLLRHVLHEPDIPIHRSESSTWNDKHASYFYGRDGHCGTLGKLVENAFTPPDTSSESYLLQQLQSYPAGEVTLVAIGPLSNLQWVEMRCPGVLKRCREIIIMGGSIYEPGNCPKTGMKSEYNFGMDSGAVRTVLGAGANLTLFPLDLTTAVRFEIDELMRRSAKTTQREFFKDCIEGTFKAMVNYEEARPEDRRLNIHDVHCFIYFSQPKLYHFEKMLLTCDKMGVLTRSSPGSPVKVAMRGKDVGAIKRQILRMFD